jgi:hypothetical protein
MGHRMECCRADDGQHPASDQLSPESPPHSHRGRAQPSAAFCVLMDDDAIH